MPQFVPPFRPGSLDALPAAERQQVHEMARTLAHAARTGQATHPLRGKNIAVLCEEPDCPHLARLQRLAGELGARVTHVRPGDALTRSPHTPEAVGSLLGRLYDAIDCHGVAPDVVARLARCTGRPVFDGPPCNAADTPESPDADFTFQAMLVRALA